MKKIIENKYKSLLSENLTNDDFSFITNNVETTISMAILRNIFNVEDIDTSEIVTTVKWYINPEIKSWGINALNIHVESVIVNIDWFVYTEDLSKEEIAHLEKMGGDNDGKTISGTYAISGWEVDEEITPREFYHIEPQEVNIDTFGIINVNF